MMIVILRLKYKQKCETCDISKTPRKWMDGSRIGYFNSNKSSNGPVEERLLYMKCYGDKSCLIIEGIEFCPQIIKCRSSEADFEDYVVPCTELYVLFLGLRYITYIYLSTQFLKMWIFSLSFWILPILKLYLASSVLLLVISENIHSISNLCCSYFQI